MSAAVIEVPGLSIEEEIGRGGRSAVYRATCGGKTVAVKVPLSGSSPDGRDTALQSSREAAYLACLKHAGLPEVLSAGAADGRPYLVMELLQGPTLAKVLADGGRIEEEEIRRIAVALGRTLREVHRRGFVHRDIKPGGRHVSLQRAGADRDAQAAAGRAIGSLFVGGGALRVRGGRAAVSVAGRRGVDPPPRGGDA